ncbi:hypothetical protein DFO77_11994 [Marinilabilia salmonicolor]|jgi:hypothetical protein|uniref:Uncharacterized protein n=1 Tax=Marinilabilia salmonicolor TaxID=989 RepID=A0A2T0XPZ5_9BACT|nr:hypothetical protein BY457_104209 [Marinilabilia salmonicolor]RCW31126.1 hypothetical protein DFO77_11994 [Marinilabilia salmonicolor]
MQNGKRDVKYEIVFCDHTTILVFVYKVRKVGKKACVWSESDSCKACEAAKTEFIWVNEHLGGKRNSLPRFFVDANGTLWTDTNYKSILSIRR